MPIRINGRKTVRLGPLYARFTFASVGRAREALAAGQGLRAALRELFPSYGWRSGRVTRNMAADTTTVDTPGMGSVTHQTGRAGRKQAGRRRRINEARRARRGGGR